jgi:hypothetical protein
VRLAGDVLEEQEQIGEAMADTTLPAGRIALLGLPALQREVALRRATAGGDAGLPVADVGEDLVAVAGGRDDLVEQPDSGSTP